MHLLLMLYAAPKKRAQIVEAINRHFVYDFEGPDLIGETRPFASEAPFGILDIRCKEIIAPFVLRDMSAACCGNLWSELKPLLTKHSGGALNYKERSLHHVVLLSLFRIPRIFPFIKTVKKADGPSMFREKYFPGWHSAFFIGALTDARHKETGEEVL